MKALILAAGYGVRLYPITKVCPKPLLPVAGKPIIEYVIDKVQAIDGVSEIIVISNSKFFPLFKKWLKSFKCSKPISLIDDLTHSNEDRRGAVGDIKFAIDKKKIREDILIIGGDNIFEDGLEGFISFVNKHKNRAAIGLYDVKSKERASKFGVASIGKGNKITGILEKPKRPNSTLIAMCLYFLPRQNLKFVEQYVILRKNKHDATGLYIDWLCKRENVYGYIFKGVWYDIGRFESYREANSHFLKQRRS